jgi:hypothetical protein
MYSANLNTIDEGDLAKTRRKYEIGPTFFEVVQKMPIQQGVPSDCVAALLDRPRIHASRLILSSGGSRLKAFETEMRSFHCEFKNPTLSYRLCQYVVVGAGTLLLPSQQFYKMRNWYARGNLGDVREEFARSR